MRSKAIIVLAGIAALAAGGYWVYKWQPTDGAAISPEAFAGSVAPDMTLCNADENTIAYVSDVQLQRLREKLYAKDLGFLGDVSTGQSRMIAASLALGTTDAFFAARVVRSAEIVRQLDLQKECMTDTRCDVTGDPADYDLADTIKSGAADDPNRDKSWSQLTSEWRGYLRQDVDRGKVCFSY